MNESQIIALIEMLENVRRRPKAYVGPELQAILQFLWGVHSTCYALFGVFRDETIYEEVLKERGWEYSAIAPWGEMRERGLDEESMLNEFVTIEIEVLKRTYKLM